MEDNNLLGQQYDLPENRDEFINTNSGEVVKQDKIDPMDVIRKIAEKIGTKIQDPKKGCKDCFGRGFIGRDTNNKAPIPCHCIYPKAEGEEAMHQQVVQEGMRKLPRHQRRKLEAYNKKMLKKKKKRKWIKKHNTPISVSGVCDE